MTDGAARVRHVLEARSATTEVRRFTAPVPSAVAAADQLGCTVGAIANSLVFTIDDDVLLVLVSGAHRVDTGKIARALGVSRRKVRRADPATVLAATGQHVGGVAPVGHPAPLRTVVDVDLKLHAVVWAGAGDEHSMFATTADDLVDLTGGRLLDVADERGPRDGSVGDHGVG